MLTPDSPSHRVVRQHASPGYDEAREKDRSYRSYWAPFFRSLYELGSHEVARRWRDAQLLIRDNGVTYNVYGDPQGMSRPWQLDPIPLLIAPEDAARLEAGLVQRARLLELILADLYGPQRLLNEGLIPPELLYPNPGFLRPCHGIRLPNNRFLHLYAANLGRSSQGEWHVLGDRTQAPSGAGYALENRIVLTRTLPEPFDECRVLRLAPFFQSFRETLRSISPRNKENPRVVLLTPGPYNETYFEHAYLARYLGYTLVEGGDLTVRDNRVFLKVLGGLQPVDVILRRLDDDFSDPLELRPDSFLGVPGLTHAVRSGNVAVANALGSGLLESPSFLPYLPHLCRAVLGEELRLNSVPTWWCGEADSLRYVLDHLGDLVVKQAFPALRMEPLFPDELSEEELNALKDRLRARPWEFVAQQRLDLSTTPVLENGSFASRKMVLRAYLAADSDGFTMMPGGLTRVSASDETMVVSMQRGGGSKDTWMLSTGAVNEFSLLPQTGRLELSRAGGDLPSRAADNLFWLGRYADRAEATTRLLRVMVGRLVAHSGQIDPLELPALLRALELTCNPDDPVTADDPLDRIIPAMFDLKMPGSLAASVQSLQRAAGLVRDLISIDMWRVLNGLSDYPSDVVKAYGEEGPTVADLLHLLDHTVITLSAFGGLAVDSMTRSEGWRFLDMGRRIERALHLVAILKATLLHPTGNEGPILDAILEAADSGMTYRRRYMSSLQAEPVIDLLVCDETSPRSLASHLLALENDVNHLPRPTRTASRSPEQRYALSMLDAVRMAEVERLAVIENETRPFLADLLKHVEIFLPAVSDAITQNYLSHLQTSRHLATSETTQRTAADSGDRL